MKKISLKDSHSANSRTMKILRSAIFHIKTMKEVIHVLTSKVHHPKHTIMIKSLALMTTMIMGQEHRVMTIDCQTQAIRGLTPLGEGQ